MSKPFSTIKDQKGRTLIELLVGLAIAGIVTVFLSSLAIQGLRLGHTSQFEDQRVYPARNTLDLVIQDVRRATYTGPCGLFPVSIGTTSPTGADIWYTIYSYDSSTRQVSQLVYASDTCASSSLQSHTAVGHNIEGFTFTPIAGTNQFRVVVRAKSKDGTIFELDQTVTGRLLGQP